MLDFISSQTFIPILGITGASMIMADKSKAGRRRAVRTPARASHTAATANFGSPGDRLNLKGVVATDPGKETRSCFSNLESNENAFALVLKGGTRRHLGCARKNSVNAEVNGVVECLEMARWCTSVTWGQLETISFIFLQYPFYLIVLWQMSIFSPTKSHGNYF